MFPKYQQSDTSRTNGRLDLNVNVLGDRSKRHRDVLGDDAWRNLLLTSVTFTDIYYFNGL